jgi:hypothetical protein
MKNGQFVNKSVVLLKSVPHVSTRAKMYRQTVYATQAVKPVRNYKHWVIYWKTKRALLKSQASGPMKKSYIYLITTVYMTWIICAKD